MRVVSSEHVLKRTDHASRVDKQYTNGQMGRLAWLLRVTSSCITSAEESEVRLGQVQLL